MTRIRFILSSLAAVFAVSAVAASAASADPGQTFAGYTGTSDVITASSQTGSSTLSVLGISITCKTGSATGQITGASGTAEATKIKVTFKNCEAEKGGKKCSTKSSKPLGVAGEIKTEELKGQLVETLNVGESATGVALLLEPVGTSFTTIEKNTCIAETKVKGSVAGEATPLAKGLKKEAVFATTGGAQNIKEVESSNDVGGPKKPKLEAFGLEATETATNVLTFEKEVEITKGE